VLALRQCTFWNSFWLQIYFCWQNKLLRAKRLFSVFFGLFWCRFK